MISFTFCDQQKITSSKLRAKNARHFVDEKLNQHSSKTKKKKSPSRQKRDRERFRKFLEKKRERKKGSFSARQSSEETLEATQLSRPVSDFSPHVQFSPPEDVTVAVPEPSTVCLSSLDTQSAAYWCNPSPTVTLSGPAQMTDTLQTNVTPEETEVMCECFACAKLRTIKDPRDGYYKACAYCKLPASEVENSLKPCSRCLYVAYCSRDCQSKDWKQGVLVISPSDSPPENGEPCEVVDFVKPGEQFYLTHKQSCRPELAPMIREQRDAFDRHKQELLQLRAECHPPAVT